MGTYGDIYGDVYGPPWPLAPLDTRTELLLGGAWADVTPMVLERGQVTIVTGHPDESSTAMPSSCALTLNNRLGQFSPRNPLSLNYGLLGRNTPLRLSLPQGGTYLRLEDDTSSFASCFDNARLGVTGDIDIRIDLELSNYALMTLVSKWASATDRAWALRLNFDGTPVFEFIDVATGDHNATCDMPIPLGRTALRVTLDVNNGTGGRTTTFYTAPTMSGTWTQLGDPIVNNTSTVTLRTSTSPLYVGFGFGYIVTDAVHSNHIGPTGRVFEAQVRSGIGGTLVADPVFTAQPAGSSMWTDAQGNLWTLGGTAQISDRNYRHHGEVPAWPPRWDTTGRDVYTPIASAGLLRRLGQGANSGAPLNSALYRAYVRLGGSIAPVAYWPCEDGSTSTQLASALGGPPMSIVGAPQLASDSSFLCSDNLPVVANSAWTGVVPNAATAANVLRFLLKVTSASAPTDGTVIATLTTLGTVTRADLIFRTAGGLQLKGYNASGTVIFDTGAVVFGILDGLWRASVELQQVGGSVQYSIVTVAPGASTGNDFTGTVTGTIGAATGVVIGPGDNLDQAVVGHVTVQAAWDSLFDIGQALNAWQQEPAASRFARLCTEEGIASRIYGFPTDSVPMGPQRLLKFTDLLQECESADKGLIYEPRQTLALGYRTRVSMFNQAAALTLAYDSAQFSAPMEPTDDDQYVTNDVTATRTGGGSSYRAVVTDGALSILQPPAGIGRYPSTDQANLFSDAQLGDDASWMAHLGTVDDVRYPTLVVDLARSELAAVYADALAVKVGDRVLGTDTPDWLPPDDISQIVRGYTEVCYSFTHKLTPVCVPESPYRVGVYDDPVLGRYDTDGSTLQLPVSSAAVSIQVATANPNSPLWTTSAGDFPFDISCGGERMTVTNITGSSSPQTFTVTRAVNGVVKPQKAGSDVRLFQPTIYSM